MEFIKGMDISFLPEMLESGAKFLDKEENERDVFELLKENGVNSIRLRIWNEPENVPESGGYCNLEQTISLAKQVKKYGMSFFLDFHYSDWWADPGKQEKPKAWLGLNFQELKEAVYNYTKEVLLCMKEEGVFPDMVQVGNEIRSGMLFPDGEVPHFDRLVALVNAGIRAVRDVDNHNETKVVIHLDQGGRFFYLRDWFNAAISAGLDNFEIIGVSYYPFWHGTFAEFKETLVKLVEHYNKPIIIAETAHPWRRAEDGFVGDQQEKIIGFPATPQAQQKVLDLVMNITASLKEEMGLGIYYWEPAVIPIKGVGGWSSNMGIFNEAGIALPALESFKFERTQVLNKIAKIYYPKKTINLIGSTVKLPSAINVLYYDGTCKQLAVEWDDFDNKKIGKHIIHGRITEINEKVQMEIHLLEKLEENHNFISNSSFENGMEGWSIACQDKRVKVEIHPEFIDPFPALPIYYVYIESPVNFELELKTKVEGLKPGIYRLQAEYRGTNTTSVDVKLFFEGKKNNIYETVIFPTDEDWITYELGDIVVKEDKGYLGLKIESPPIFGRVRKFTLTRQSE